MGIGTITFTVDEDTNTHNTSRKTSITAPFHKMVELFGEPLPIDADHSRVHWPITFSDGGVADIYDWNEDVRIEDVTQWNVGGHDFMTAGRVHDILAGRPIIA